MSLVRARAPLGSLRARTSFAHCPSSRLLFTVSSFVVVSVGAVPARFGRCPAALVIGTAGHSPHVDPAHVSCVQRASELLSVRRTRVTVDAKGRLSPPHDERGTLRMRARLARDPRSSSLVLRSAQSRAHGVLPVRSACRRQSERRRRRTATSSAVGEYREMLARPKHSRHVRSTESDWCTRV